VNTIDLPVFSKKDYLAVLEKLFWNNTPQCYYCKSHHFTPIKGNRYHCIDCNISFSVTVGTMFHKTRVNFNKWFYFISLFLGSGNKINIRRLAKDIALNRITVTLMLSKAVSMMSEKPDLLLEICKCFKGLNKNQIERSTKVNLNHRNKARFDSNLYQSEMIEKAKEIGEKNDLTFEKPKNKKMLCADLILFKSSQLIEANKRHIKSVKSMVKHNKTMIKYNKMTIYSL
jgi:transposase-like protein